MCLRRHECSTEMYSHILHASVRGTFFILTPFAKSLADESDQTCNNTRGEAHKTSQLVFAPSSATTADALIHVLSEAVKPNGAKDTDAVAKWVSNLIENPKSEEINPIDTLLVMSGALAVVVWVPGVHYSLQRAVKSGLNWPIEYHACATEAQTQFAAPAALWASASKLNSLEGAATPKPSGESSAILCDFLIRQACGEKSDQGSLNSRSNRASSSSNSENVRGASDIAAPAERKGIMNVDVRVVSLARRQDRWRTFVARNSAMGLAEGRDFKKFDAVDGRTLSATDPRLPRYFKPLPTPNSSLASTITATALALDAAAKQEDDMGADSKSAPKLSEIERVDIWESILRRSPGLVGCGLSHVALWEELVMNDNQIKESTKSNPNSVKNSTRDHSSGKCTSSILETKECSSSNGPSSSDKKVEEYRGDQLLVVLEDDAEVLCTRDVWMSLISSLQPNFDGVLQLGFHARKEPSAAEVWDNHHTAFTETPSQEPNVRVVPLPFERFLGGTFGYVISARQAQRFLNVLGSRVPCRTNSTNSSSGSNHSSSSSSSNVPVEGKRKDEVCDGRFGGATFAVDHFMRAHTEARHWWATEPRIVHADFAYASNGAVDSDVASGA